MKLPVVIQARAGSSRLPGKIFAQLGDTTVLALVIDRCKLARQVSEVVVATSTRAQDDPVQVFCEKIGVRVVRGSEEDVLSRFILAATHFKEEALIRVTADSPFVDPKLIDQLVETYARDRCDYVYLSELPNGIGSAEVIKISALKYANQATRPDETHFREHVMTYLTAHPEIFSLKILPAEEKLRRPDLRLSIDEQSDLDVVKKVYAHFAPRRDFGTQEIIDFLDQYPEIKQINARVQQRS